MTPQDDETPCACVGHGPAFETCFTEGRCDLCGGQTGPRVTPAVDDETRIAAIQERAEGVIVALEQAPVYDNMGLSMAHSYAVDFIRELLAEVARLQAERDELRKKLLREGTDEADSTGAATAPTDGDRIVILCSECFDAAGHERVRGCYPQAFCSQCGRACMGYGAALEQHQAVPAVAGSVDEGTPVHSRILFLEKQLQAAEAARDEAQRERDESYVVAQAILNDEPYAGSYVHLVTCGASRREPVGNSCCSCPIGRRIKKALAAVATTSEIGKADPSRISFLENELQEAQRSAAVSLSRWTRHHSHCARVTDAAACSCGLQEALLALK